MTRLLSWTVVCLALAVSAQAQPYVYVTTSSGFFRGVEIVPLTPRLVTVDTATGEAISSLSLFSCFRPTDVTVAPDGTRVYISCDNSQGPASGRIVVVDPATKQVVEELSFASAAPRAVAVTPDGSRLLIALSDDTVRVFDRVSLLPIVDVPAGPGAKIVVAPDSSRAYISSPGETVSAVKVLDLNTYTIADSISVGAGSAGLAISSDATRVVVTNAGDGSLSVISTATHTVDATIPIADPSAGQQIQQVAVNPTGSIAWVPVLSFGSVQPSVKVVDLTSNTVTSSLPPFFGLGIAASATGDRLFVSTRPADQTSVVTVDPVAGSVISSALVRGGPQHLAVAPPGVTPLTDPCTYDVAFGEPRFFSTPPLASPAGTTKRLLIMALPDRCAWTAESNVPWISLQGIVGGPSGTVSGRGPDNIQVTVDANLTGQPRTGTISIAGQALTVAQAGCSAPVIVIDRPEVGSSVNQPYRISGWAIDPCAPSGTGIAPPPGNPVNYGGARPDVAAVYGPEFLNSGFDFLNLFEEPPGPKSISVLFRSTITGEFHRETIGPVNVLASARPFGMIDTPGESATVSGEMVITGWVLDDVGVLGNLLVYRNAVPGETPSPNVGDRVFVGVAQRIRGARPDIEAAFPGFPQNDRAGFALIVLTNTLPNGGNGTFTFEVLVADRLGIVWLGPRTVTADNSSSLLPFGTLDTPAPGSTVSGVLRVFGWALSPHPQGIDPSGNTIDVYVDDVFFGHPSYGHFRSDIATLFPGYANSNGAVGFSDIQTLFLDDGLHTISWVVRDEGGNARGIGSRFFTVRNN
jgi:YVTN family beta-propeller protein